jgi:hypothetical protein
MALTTRNVFVHNYDLPSHKENERVATQEPTEVPAMFWQCSYCDAAVIFLLDECPHCDV